MQPFLTKREIWRLIHGISVELFGITCIVFMVLDLCGAPASWHIETWVVVFAVFVLLGIYPWRNCRVWYGTLFYSVTIAGALCYAVFQWIFPDGLLVLILKVLWGLSTSGFTILEVLYWRWKRRKDRVQVVQMNVSSAKKPMNDQEYTQACRELADAILAGCQLTKKTAFGFFGFDGERDTSGSYRVIEACAAGAAVIGKLDTLQDPFPDLLTEGIRREIMVMFPVLAEYLADSPAIHTEVLFINAITTLNDFGIDDDPWSREQIVEWICSVPARVNPPRTGTTDL